MPRAEFLGYRGTGTDITEQLKAEAALQESELRLRRIIDLVPHMIFAKDRHGPFPAGQSRHRRSLWR